MSYSQNWNYQTSLDNNKNRTSTNFRYVKQKFCPFQRYVDHRPYPYRPLSNTTTNRDFFNYPTEKEKYISCYKYINKQKLFPLVTRSDLAKYLKLEGTLLRHQTPCYSCNKINGGNYGRNYYSLTKKSFPFIKGNFCGNLTKFNPRQNTPSSSRNQTNKIKDKFFQGINDRYNNNFNTEGKNLDKNSVKKMYDTNKKEERKNENNDDINFNEYIQENESKRYKFLSRNASDNHFYRPVIKTTFHKAQIFDHCKPYLVDEFKEYGGYK